MFKTKPSIIASAVLLSLGLSACGGSSNSSTPAPTPTPTPTNTAPTAVALSNLTISEHTVGGIVGTVTVTDDNANDTHTLAISDDRFEISETGILKLKSNYVLSNANDAEVVLTITATDQGSLSKDQEFTLTTSERAGVYSFVSATEESQSSVSHSGQAARQVLILELNNYIASGLATDVTAAKFSSAEEVKAKLMRMFAATAEQWEEDADDTLTFTTTPAAKQTTLRQISSSYKNLKAKIAGEDATGQHKDWATELVGWGNKGSVTPSGVVEALFDQLAANALTAINGTVRNDIAGNPITKLYINTDGTDIKQLVQKFLLGAVNYSQGTDDYLDNTVDTKGLLSVNTQDGTKTYTKLEHQFDEGFGYFGPAHNFNEYTDLEIRAKSGRDSWSSGYNDINADGMIDLTSEINFANSVNAAKRDLGTVDNANPTDFTKQAFDAFVAGRKIINAAAGEALTADQMTALLAQRDIAVLVWEKAISATVVHYVNDVKADLDKLGATDYSSDDYANLAKHWSELKGFSLNLQFNPHTPMTDAQFTTMQDNIGMKPVLTKAEVAAYKAKLDEVNTMLQAVYGFDAENVEKW